jgi:hypothetical protein
MKYQSGEEIRQGDKVRYDGELGEIEFVAEEGDPAMDWYIKECGGPGVMVIEPKVFGRVYISDTENEEDLILVSRQLQK